KHLLQRSGIDRSLTNINIDPAQLPSASKYFARHSLRDVKERLRNGLRSMFKLAFIDYAPLYYLLLVWAGLALWALCHRWPASWREAWDWKCEVFFIAALLTLFTYLFGWFVPIKAGPRLIDTVTMPA